MKIEVPNNQDYERVNELAVMLHDMHVEWRPDIFIHTDIVFTKEEFYKMIVDKTIFTAKIDSIIVGYVVLGPVKEGKKSGYHYRKILSIDALVVDEKMRNKGVGTALFSHVVNYAKSCNCTGIHLTVNEENVSAIHLYEKMGMKVKNISYSMDL